MSLSERQIRWLFGSVGVSAFVLLLVLDVLTDETGIALLELILDAFPEGTYRFRGRTVSGDCLRGEAFLSHEIAPAAELLPPRRARPCPGTKSS